MKNSFRTLDEADLRGKRVLVRVDDGAGDDGHAIYHTRLYRALLGEANRVPAGAREQLSPLPLVALAAAGEDEHQQVEPFRSEPHQIGLGTDRGERRGANWRSLDSRYAATQHDADARQRYDALRRHTNFEWRCKLDEALLADRAWPIFGFKDEEDAALLRAAIKIQLDRDRNTW